VLPRRWFGRDSWEVAPSLLNKVLAVRSPSGWRWVRITEVEAYASFDPASHSYRGPTPRSTVMFGPPGHLYVYFSYGVHWCANIVTGPSGSGQAVLLRAGEPLGGIAADGLRRPISGGPALLARALGLTGSDTGLGLGRRPAPERCVVVLDDGVPPGIFDVGPRIGITKATEVPWRWRVSRGSPSSP
jgi:DNA-3-methyladenine glycosylase